MDVHVYIGVTDLEHGIAFYTQGLGLRFRRRLRSNWVELEGASVPIFLLVSHRPRDFAGPWTVHLDCIAADLDAAVRQAQDAGAVLDCPLQEREWGRMANMTAPFGNSFDLIACAPGGYDNMAQTPCTWADMVTVQYLSQTKTQELLQTPYVAYAPEQLSSRLHQPPQQQRRRLPVTPQQPTEPAAAGAAGDGAWGMPDALGGTRGRRGRWKRPFEFPILATLTP